eukprot:SAG31_NODE_4512_length_3176_cov_2.548261_4_plen_109_part_01
MWKPMLFRPNRREARHIAGSASVLVSPAAIAPRREAPPIRPPAARAPGRRRLARAPIRAHGWRAWPPCLQGGKEQGAKVPYGREHVRTSVPAYQPYLAKFSTYVDGGGY